MFQSFRIRLLLTIALLAAFRPLAANAQDDPDGVPLGGRGAQPSQKDTASKTGD
jgi:hypothetical protein